VSVNVILFSFIITQWAGIFLTAPGAFYLADYFFGYPMPSIAPWNWHTFDIITPLNWHPFDAIEPEEGPGVVPAPWDWYIFNHLTVSDVSFDEETFESLYLKQVAGDYKVDTTEPTVLNNVGELLFVLSICLYYLFTPKCL
jgi:hypothetical protein